MNASVMSCGFLPTISKNLSRIVLFVIPVEVSSSFMWVIITKKADVN
jgi:hypothetical protein